MIRLWETDFQNPIMLAAGTAGFGREVDGLIDLDRLGGIVTKAVSPEPRRGNPAPRVAEYPGGMINSVGLANPGVRAVAEHMLPWLAEHLSRARVFVNVVGSVPSDYEDVVRRLGEMNIVTAFELNVSCPNTDRGGEEFGADPEVLSALVHRCVTVTDKPVLVKLAPTLADIGSVAGVAAEAGASGISVVNTFPGLVFEDPRLGVSRLGAGRGGVSGPVLLPIGILATQRTKEVTGLPVVGVGGIRTLDDVFQYLSAGADLVALGTAALADPRCPERLVSAWRSEYKRAASEAVEAPSM